MVDKPAVGLMKHQKVSFPLQPSNPTIFSWDPFLKKGYGKWPNIWIKGNSNYSSLIAGNKSFTLI